MQLPVSYLITVPQGTILESSFAEFWERQRRSLAESLVVPVSGWINPPTYRQLRLPGF